MSLSLASALQELAALAQAALEEPNRVTSALAEATTGSSRIEPQAAANAARAAITVTGQAVVHVRGAAQEFTSYAHMV